ncbi:MAG: asparagine synthase [Alphaproteobacteria bacterium]|nr:asparagine synthase [Alphaproteobacteria bacterium]
MDVRDEGLGADGTADATVRIGRHTVFVDGWTPAGPEALARAMVEGGPRAVASWPGDWAAVSKQEGREGLEVAVDGFGGRVAYTDGRRVTSSPEALGDLRERPIDVEGMATQLTGWIDDPTPTLVRGITRVPAGYGGHVGAAVRLARIWVPRPESHERPALALRAIVETAVRERRAHLGGTPTVALSGGLDSSVLAGVLADQGEVRAVSNRFAGWAADEGPWIDVVAAMHRVPVEAVDSRALDPMEVLERLAPPGFPPVLVNHHLNLALLRAAGPSLWTGFGGDEVFGHGLDLVRELAEDGRTLRAAWEAFWLARRFRHARIGQLRALRMWGGRWIRASMPDRARRRVPGRPRGTLQRRIETVTHPLIARSREEQQRLAAGEGRTLVMPFLDPRVATVCLGVPARQLVRRGRTRHVVREAFADLLPDAVRRRSDKADLSRALDEPFRDVATAIRADLLAPWCTTRRIDELHADFERGSHDAAADLFRLAGASRWLEWHAGLRGGDVGA